MAKGDRKYNQLTRGVRLTDSQKRTVRKQIDNGVQTPTLRVGGLRVTLDQLKTAQDLTDRSQADKRRKTPKTPRLRYNSQGVATTKSGVQITREQAKEFRDRARRINQYSERQQFNATLANVVVVAQNNTNDTIFYPASARRAPLPYQRVDFSRFKSQEDFAAAVEYQNVLYDPKTRTSSRNEYLGDTLRRNWKKALVKQVGNASAAPILNLVDRMDGLEFRALLDSGKLASVGDVYHGDPATIRASLDNYYDTISEIAGDAPVENPEDIGLLD